MSTRRTFLEAALAPLLVVGLLDTLVASDAVLRAVRPILKGWLRELHGRCADLRGGAIPAAEWQGAVAGLLERVPRTCWS